MASIADTFNRTDNAALGTSSDGLFSWNELGDFFQIVSNQCKQAASGTAVARAEIDLVSDDHSAQVEFHTSSNIGVAARFDSAVSNTFYLLQVANSTTLQLFKQITGSFTQLGSNATITFSAGEAYKLECNSDDSIKGYQAGVERISVSAETSITGKFRTGIRSDTLNAIFDNFAASDNAAGASRPVKMAGEWLGFAGNSGGFAG